MIDLDEEEVNLGLIASFCVNACLFGDAVRERLPGICNTCGMSVCR